MLKIARWIVYVGAATLQFACGADDGPQEESLGAGTPVENSLDASFQPPEDLMAAEAHLVASITLDSGITVRFEEQSEGVLSVSARSETNADLSGITSLVTPGDSVSMVNLYETLAGAEAPEELVELESRMQKPAPASLGAEGLGAPGKEGDGEGKLSAFSTNSRFLAQSGGLNFCERMYLLYRFPSMECLMNLQIDHDVWKKGRGFVSIVHAASGTAYHSIHVPGHFWQLVEVAEGKDTPHIADNDGHPAEWWGNIHAWGGRFHHHIGSW